MMKKRFEIAGIWPVLAVTLFLGSMLFDFLNRMERKYEDVNKALAEKTAVVLSPGCDSLLAAILYNDGYVQSEKDADYIAKVLAQRRDSLGRLPSLYTLQKRAFGQIPAMQAQRDSVLTKVLDVSCDHLGQREALSEYHPDSIGGRGVITVTVLDDPEPASLFRRPDRKLCKDVKIRLQCHYRDSVGRVESKTLGYLKTNSDGMAVFDRLDTEKSYSVLPVREGFEYGASRGTLNGRWEKESLSFTFIEKEHRIPLLDNATLRRIKDDRTIMVRTPDEFKGIVLKWFVLVVAMWWVLCLFILIAKKRLEGLLTGACMFLSCLCVLMMFSMQDPINDELNGVVMAKGVLLGLGVCLLFQGVNFVKFYQDNLLLNYDAPVGAFRWFFLPFRQKVAGLAEILKGKAGFLKKAFALLLVVLALPFIVLDLLQITRLGNTVGRWCAKLPKGIGWLLVALLLTSLLWTPFGMAIGGMKVNLNLFGIVFQPSEIAKYLILLFMAAFFTRQADTIIAYSQPNRMDLMASKLKTLIWLIVGLGALMMMYMALGDMGPGLVIGITFILLYSLVKSKVNLENTDENTRWHRVFTCDFAMLVYGVLSFAAMLLVGHLLGVMLWFGVLWFVLWILMGRFAFKKQLFESALLMNLVIFVFVVGGNMGSIPGLKDTSLAKRFEERTMMCTNTWGDLDLEHLGGDEDPRPVPNTQVANGLWSMATGGLLGQSLGAGKPTLTPAFHTDMILSSIGEQLGWLGLLFVVVALALLLRRMAVIGYRVGHPFAFYLCMGFSIVTAVQFFIIALGSSGVIPLTGVTVPFLSYGRVSMILNLSAFGIVLSLANNNNKEPVAEKAGRKAVGQYGYPVALSTLTFLFFAIGTLLVWQWYQVWNRDNTLVRPAFVLDSRGMPTVEYNPRIALLVKNMEAGNIYDRNNVLLATSYKDAIEKDSYAALGVDTVQLANMLKRPLKRYYPLGNQMFFMVGDNVPFSVYYESQPLGYLADHQHLSYLRGFDNILYDDAHHPVKVILPTDRYRESSFMNAIDTVSDAITIRDYRPLLKYLKDGIDGEEVRLHNEQMRNGGCDLHLTVDAALQIDLQNGIEKHMKENYGDKEWFHLMRVSAVVLDAENGDLLASANYPLPDYDRIELNMDHAYSDNYKMDEDWWAYTDRDLGTTYMTPPGSTAKVMSAMAGLRKDPSCADEKYYYYISKENAIEGTKDKDGNIIKATEPVDDVSMEKAIVKSSNCYFISLVNDKDLYADLDSIYSTVGVRIGDITPYYYDYYSRNYNKRETQYHDLIEWNGKVAVDEYKEFVLNGSKGSMNKGAWRWAWGHGNYTQSKTLDFGASPLVMARVAAAVVNGGAMPVVQYVKEDFQHRGTIPLLNPTEALILKGFMQSESKKDDKFNGWNGIGGKTGTADRAIWKYGKDGKKYEDKLNDCWYMCFVESGSRRYSIVVRIERVEKGNVARKTAVPLVSKVVLNSLKSHHYIE